LDTHIDKFKIQEYFNKGDIILDPFYGSGTTLTQSNELGLHAIGIADYDIKKLDGVIEQITLKFYANIKTSEVVNFGNRLIEKLKDFNDKYFPVPEFKYKLRRNLLDESQYGSEKENYF
jgi:hypothetical protein